MRVLILYSAPGDQAAEADVLAQVAWARETLQALGCHSDDLALANDLSSLERQLATNRPDVVLYLVESFVGTDALLYFPAEFLQAQEVPFTGSPSTVLHALVSKSAVKKQLTVAGLPTPVWMSPDGQLHGDKQFDVGQYILKPDLEHASLGLDQSSVVVATSRQQLRIQCSARSRLLQLPCLAERFVLGREFNVSLLDRGDGTPEVLPLAEIDFSALPREHLPIVDWNAKWVVDSLEYLGTPRTFPDLSTEPELAQRLTELAVRCWNLCGLRGYARIDFRVDDQQQPWILEINANPCLSPDAGFQAACQARGLSSAQIMQRILAAADSSLRLV